MPFFSKEEETHGQTKLEVKDVTCGGCLSTTGRLSRHCYECDIRLCGVGRGLPNCAYCDEFEACDKLTRFWGLLPNYDRCLRKFAVACDLK